MERLAKVLLFAVVAFVVSACAAGIYLMWTAML
jgi:hypothetical protein